MISYKFNLYIEQGTDYSKEIILYDEYNNVINLTGYNVIATWTAGYSSTLYAAGADAYLNMSAEIP